MFEKYTDAAIDAVQRIEMSGRAFLGMQWRDQRAELGIGEIISSIIAIVVGAILVGALLPTAVNNTNTGLNTSWNSSLQSTWNAIPIMEVVSGLLIFVAIVTKLSKS